MDIPNFYAGANILVTGGTGFVGVCLVEKLLRCIPDIGNVYLLIRQKQRKAIHMRLNDLVSNRVFNTLRNERGTIPFQKLHAIEGDIGVDGLGLSADNEQLLLTKVNVVFHCAACLDFDETLRNAININLLGTRRVVELCKKMTNLIALVQVSSAYANANRRFAQEVLYPVPTDGDKMVKLIENLDDKTINNIMSTILQNWPNAYTLTKCLAEYEVASAGMAFPAAVVRPSMIIGSWKEPVPGWTTGKNGMQSFLMAMAKGVVRRLPVDKHLVYDYIPVDTVVNGIISSGWYVGIHKPSQIWILHCTTSMCNPFKWSDIESHIPEMLNCYPLMNTVWYPTLKLVSSMTMYKVSAFVFHMIPAYILDFLVKCTGGKPVLVELHHNFNNSLNKLAPFIFNEWKFENTNCTTLHQSLSYSDQQAFGMDVSKLVWKVYFDNLTLGVRTYLNNESLHNLAAAKRRNNCLWLLNILVQIFVAYALFFIVCVCSGTSWFMNLWCVPVIAFFLNYL